MKADAPEISIIIPAYNAAATLPQQLDALTRSTPAFDYEIVVCDNGSTDDTASVVREWSMKVPVRLVDASARRGPAAARNIGAAAARSERLAFCDADDEVGQDWIARMKAALEAHEFVAGSFEFLRLNEGIDVPGMWTPQSDGLTHKSYLPSFAVAGSGNMGIRRAVFEEVDGFLEQLRTAEDDDLCLRVQLAGHALVFVPELVLHVRRRGGFVALCRQAYTYAVGEKRLLYRYADVILPSPDDDAATHPTQRAQVRVAGNVAKGVARAARKVVSIRSLGDVAPVAWRWSWRLGWAFTREDRSIPRIQWPPAGAGGRPTSRRDC